MKQLNYTLSFNTPAFLGNAEQQAQWRTPPIKALIRQWWRVAYAVDQGFKVDLEAMRREEGLLFGNAWLSHQENERKVTDHCKSRMRIRLSNWTPGKLRTWEGLEQEKVDHPETEKTGHKVGPHAYLGYGPLDGGGKTQFGKKHNAAIQAGESATLSIAIPESDAPRLEKALWLMDRYGTLGGRSRNGWGSFSLTPKDETSRNALASHAAPLNDWHHCLDLDWPHAIGQDEQSALIWQTIPHADWQSLMKTLAEVKIKLRTQFIFSKGKDAARTEARHWLAYPVTNHSVKAWESNARLPNTLRFKVRPWNKQWVGVIFHVPHIPPLAFSPNRAAIEQVWRQVYAFLNHHDCLTRIPE